MAIARITTAISPRAPDATDPEQMGAWVSGELLPVVDWLRSSVNQAAAMTADPTVDGSVGLLLSVQDAGVITVQQVSVGAADSGGVGFRLLRIPN